MAVTAASLKARYPEFSGTPDATVTSAIAEAERRNDARVFGAAHDDAVTHYAAHLLAISPSGQPARLESEKDADTIYRREWLRIAKQRASGPWFTGQLP